MLAGSLQDAGNDHNLHKATFGMWNSDISPMSIFILKYNRCWGEYNGGDRKKRIRGFCGAILMIIAKLGGSGIV